MKLKDEKTEAKIGTLVIGRSASQELVIGTIVSIDETRKTVVVEHLHPQSNTALANTVVTLASVVGPGPK